MAGRRAEDLSPAELAADPTTAYALDVRDGRIVAGRLARHAAERHLRDFQDQGGNGLHWRPQQAAHAIEFFPAVLTITAGAKAGDPFVLLPWHLFTVGNLFGWRRADGLRRFRTAWMETGKGQAKSPLMAGIGLYLMGFCGIARAEIYAIAGDKDQANVLFKDGVAMCRGQIPGEDDGDTLETRGAVLIRGTGDISWKIEHPASGSKFEAVASSDAISGPRPTAVLADEIHEFKSASAIDGINKRMAAFNKEVARTRAPFEQLSKNVSKFTQVTGLAGLASGMAEVARTSLDAFRSVGRLVEPLAAITGVASVAGVYRLATQWAEFGTALGQAANRAGLASDKLHALESAGQLAGISADAVGSGMTALRDNMVKATGGQAPQVIAMLQALGLSASDAGRFAKDTTKALPELADRIAALKDPTLQAQAATALFGGAGEAMLPFLQKGAAGIAAYEDKARSFGVMNQAAVDAANKLREAQASLNLAVAGFGNTLAEKLAPHIGPVVETMARWVAANREWVGQAIGDRVGEFVTWLEKVDWSAVADNMRQIYEKADGVAQALGGWKTVGEALVAFFVTSWAARMMAPILLVGNSLAALPVKAVTAVQGANLALAKFGLAGRLAGAAGGLGLAALGWEGANMLGDATAQKQDGYANLLHNMIFDPNPLHWTQSYHPEGAAGSGASAAPSAQSVQTGAASHAEFYQKWGPAAERAAVQLGVSKETVLGHWAQETGFGRNIHDNNPGNIQAGAGYQGATVVRGDTHADGSAYQTRFRAYQKPEDFADDYVALLKRRYGGAVGAGSDALKFGQGLKAGGYMENPNGAADIARTADRVKRELAVTAPAGPDRNLPQNAGTAAAPGSSAAAEIASQVAMKVTFDNLPQNARVSTTQTGPGLAPLKVERTGVGLGGGLLGGM